MTLRKDSKHTGMCLLTILCQVSSKRAQGPGDQAGVGLVRQAISKGVIVIGLLGQCLWLNHNRTSESVGRQSITLFHNLGRQLWTSCGSSLFHCDQDGNCLATRQYGLEIHTAPRQERKACLKTSPFLV